jgi:L-ascorbate metabolism protein UlaG (beta-lactamase superfamily)
MKIKWLGHSCFQITADDGFCVVTDPYDETVGYDLGAPRADAVTVSHEHFDHSAAARIGGQPTVLNQPGEYALHGAKFCAIPCFHDQVQGARRGKNLIFVMDIQGKRLVHLGDLGHQLEMDALKELGKVDVLMIPVGGFYTIDSECAARLTREIGAELTIAMHFKTDKIDFPIEDEKHFLDLTDGKKLDSAEILLEEGAKHPAVIALSVQNT